MANRIDDDFGWNPYWELEGGPFIDTLPSAVAGERNGVDLGSFGTGMVVEGMNLPESQLPIKANTSSMVRTAGDTSQIPVQMLPMQMPPDVEDILSMVPPMDTETQSDFRLGIGEVGDRQPAQPPAQLLTTASADAPQQMPAIPPVAPVEAGPIVAPPVPEAGSRPTNNDVPPEMGGVPVEQASDRGSPRGPMAIPDVPASIGTAPASIAPIPTQPMPPANGPERMIDLASQDRTLGAPEENVEPPRIAPRPRDTDVTEEMDGAPAPTATAASPAFEPPGGTAPTIQGPVEANPMPGPQPPPPVETPPAVDRGVTFAPAVFPATGPETAAPTGIGGGGVEASDIGEVRPSPVVVPENPVLPGVPEAATPPTTPVAAVGEVSASDVGTIPVTREIPPPVAETVVPTEVPPAPRAEGVAERAVESVAPAAPAPPTVAATPAGVVSAGPGMEETTDFATAPSRRPIEGVPTEEPSGRAESGTTGQNLAERPTIGPEAPVTQMAAAVPPVPTTTTGETVAETDRVGSAIPPIPSASEATTGGIRPDELGAGSPRTPEPSPPAAAPPATVAPATTTGHEAAERGDGTAGALYGSVKDTGQGVVDDRWRRETRRNEGVTLMDLMDGNVLASMMADAAAEAMSNAKSGGATALAGAAFTGRIASESTPQAQMSGQSTEVATSDIPMRAPIQTAAEGTSMGRSMTEDPRSASVDDRGEDVGASDRIRGTGDVRQVESPAVARPIEGAAPASEPRRMEDRSIYQSDGASRTSVQSIAAPAASENRAGEAARQRTAESSPAASTNPPPRGSSGTLITGNVAQEVQSALNSGSTNPDIQRAFDAMFESKRDGLRSQMRDEASDVSGKAIGETFRTFLKGA